MHFLHLFALHVHSILETFEYKDINFLFRNSQSNRIRVALWLHKRPSVEKKEKPRLQNDDSSASWTVEILSGSVSFCCSWNRISHATSSEAPGVSSAACSRGMDASPHGSIFSSERERERGPVLANAGNMVIDCECECCSTEGCRLETKAIFAG